MQLSEFRDLLANDGFAATFQTMGQYRTELLRALDKLRAQADARPVANEREAFEAACRKLADMPEDAHELLYPGDEANGMWALWKEARATHPEASAPGLSDVEMVETWLKKMGLSNGVNQDQRDTLAAFYRFTRASAATVAEPSDETASYKRMFEDAVSSLAAIDDALGIDPDESGGAAPILEAIAALKKQAAVATAALPDELKGVPETIKEGSGIWRTCTGCYESEDGHAVGDYPHSKALDCTLGGGCSECGGIGAVWDTTDYAAMADEGWAQMQREQAAQQQAEPRKFEVSEEWLSKRLAIADDADCAAGQSAPKRPCDAPPGCNGNNCLGCGEQQAEPGADERTPEDDLNATEGVLDAAMCDMPEGFQTDYPTVAAYAHAIWQGYRKLLEEARAAQSGQRAGEYPALRLLRHDGSPSAMFIHSVHRDEATGVFDVWVSTPEERGGQRAGVARPRRDQEAAYHSIDRFLRNNLCDEDYAEYSAELDSLLAAPTQQQEGV